MKFAKLMLLAGLCLLLPVSAAAAGATVSLAPTPLQIPTGQVIPLAVKVANVEGLYGFDVKIKFDPTVIQIEDADPNMPGVQWLPGDFLSYDLSPVNTADNAAGTAQLVVSQLNPAEAKSGTGTLASLYVKGKAAGTAAVEITGLTLASRDGMAIPATSSNGSVQVTAGSAALPANPTVLPTAPAPKLEITPGALPAATATPKVTQAPATAVPPTTAPGTTPAAEAATAAPSATLAPAEVSTPAGGPTAQAGAGDAPAATAQPVEPAAQHRAATSPAGATAVAATGQATAAAAGAIIPPTPAAPTRVEAATQEGRGNSLFLAGGGLLLLAAAGIAAVVVLRRGK